jgi:hypothetical protein
MPANPTYALAQNVTSPTQSLAVPCHAMPLPFTLAPIPRYNPNKHTHQEKEKKKKRTKTNASHTIEGKPTWKRKLKEEKGKEQRLKEIPCYIQLSPPGVWCLMQS